MKYLRRIATILWRILKWTAAAILTLLALILLFYTSQAVQRPARRAVNTEIADGITYSRHVWNEPHRAVVHLIELDLTVDGIEIFTTPPDQPGDFDHLLARTTTQFAEEYDAPIVVNASFFFPIDYTVTDFYPQVGEPVSSVGLTISEGAMFSPEDDDGFHTLCILPTHVEIRQSGCSAETVEAVSGSPIFLFEGEPNRDIWEFETRAYPRSAVGIDATGRRVWLLVADGQQPGYSRGVTFAQMADFMLELGAVSAINLDGGGSATMAIGGVLTSAPIQNQVPMRQRPVANHLGVKYGVSE